MKLGRIRFSKKFFLVLTLLVIACLFLTIFHHHADGQDHADCPVCRLVQQAAAIIILAIVAILPAAQRIDFLPCLNENFTAVFSPSSLQGRAPPSVA
jgi:hypothetical protein